MGKEYIAIAVLMVLQYYIGPFLSHVLPQFHTRDVSYFASLQQVSRKKNFKEQNKVGCLDATPIVQRIRSIK